MVYGAGKSRHEEIMPTSEPVCSHPLARLHRPTISISALGLIRTGDLAFRKRLLYPPELRGLS